MAVAMPAAISVLLVPLAVLGYVGSTTRKCQRASLFAADRSQHKAGRTRLRDSGGLFADGAATLRVIALRWRNVQVQGSKMTLIFEHCKGGKEMRDTVPMPVANALLEWLTMAYGKLRGLPGDAPL